MASSDSEGDDLDKQFQELQDALRRQIYEHPLSHETMGGVRGLVSAPREVFKHDDSRIEDLYVLLRKINPEVCKLDNTEEHHGTRRFRETILNQPKGGTRARVLTILLDIDIARTSDTWVNFAKHLNVENPDHGNKELRDHNLPFSLSEIEGLFGQEHANEIYERQHKFCVPLTAAFEEAMEELELTIGKKFCPPKTNDYEKEMEIDEVHVSYFCPDDGPAAVVKDNPELIKKFFVQCRLARIVKYGTKDITKQYKLKVQALCDAETFLHGVLSRAKILAILVDIGLNPTNRTWDRFFELCLEFSPSVNDEDDDTANDESTPAPDIDPELSDASLPLPDVDSVIRHFALSSHRARKFLSSQYMYCAATLEEGDQVAISVNHRLPLSRKDLIGEGSYGKVYSVKVVPGHIKDREGRRLAHEESLAMKHGNPESPDEWRKLAWVLEQKLSHECIMRARAAFHASTDMFVFFDLADCNLHDFMRKDEHFGAGPTTTEKRLKMLKYIRDIADAIQYLHRRLKDTKGKPVVCYHKDLRADNILVNYRDDDDMLFRITDFGISSIQSSLPQEAYSNRRYSQIAQSVLSTSHAMTSAQIGQNCSNFAPEALKGQIDDRADIWAYGTVYAEYVIWLSGGSKKLMEYVEARQLGGYEWSFERDESAGTTLRSTIETFFNDIIQKTEEGGDRRIYDSSWRLLKEKLLVCEPKRRANIKDTYRMLCNICEEVETPDVLTKNMQDNDPGPKTRSQSEPVNKGPPRSLSIALSSNEKEPNVTLAELAESKTFPSTDGPPSTNGSL